MFRPLPRVAALSRDRFGSASRRAGLLVLTLVGVVCIAPAENASAQAPFGFGFQPFGFYQPYGIQYQSAVPTPPYFAVNPPVYYGTRYRRPYGISPFASPPVVQAPASYQAGPDAAGMRSGVWPAPVTNPYICTGESPLVSGSQSAGGKMTTVSSGDPQEATDSVEVSRPGQVRQNPFVAKEELQLARR